MLIQSQALSQFPELIVGFSTAEDGNMSYKKNDPEADKNNRAFYAKLNVDPGKYEILNPELRHSGNVALVTPGIARRGYTEIHKYSNETRKCIKGPLDYSFAPDSFRGIDACVSQSTGCLITIRPADCGAIFVYNPYRRVFGLIHASTATLFAGIIARTLKLMHDSFDSVIDETMFFVGPCIGKDQYDLRKSGLYKKYLHTLITPEQAEAFDIKEKILEDLLSAGAAETNIEFNTACTAVSDDFFSNHASNGSDPRRMLAVIGLR